MEIIDRLLLTVSQWMSGGLALAAAGAFAWGMVSVLFSPCHLASIPLIVADVGGRQKRLCSRQPQKMAADYNPIEYEA
jgi:cytochrome c-type biogenesis protein